MKNLHSKTSSAISAVTLLAFVSIANAATITWDTATDTTGLSDLVGGTYVYAMNGAASGVGSITGGFTNVDFTTLSAGVSISATAGGSTFGARAVNDVEATGIADAAFLNVINSVTDSNGSGGGGITAATMTFANLTDGQDYQFQLFYNDQRDTSSGRSMIFGDGVNTVTLAGDSGTAGQYAIGSFTALGTSQDLTMATSGFGNVHFNAIVLTAIPEPSAYALMAGTLALASVMIRRRIS